MSFENLRGVLSKAGDAVSMVRLALAAAYSSRPGTRALLAPLLRLASRRGKLAFRYRQHGKRLSGAVRLSDLESDILGFYEVVVRDCYRVPSWLRPASVIDCGANLGFFTISALARWPSAATIAVEPLAENVSMLEDSLVQNGMCAKVIHAAVALAAGPALFHLREPNRGSLRAEEGPSRGAVKIHTVRLSDIYAARAPGPCLVKLDVEGAELEVLEEFLQAPRPDCVIVGELHDWPKTRLRFDSLMAHAGYIVDFYAQDAVCALFTAVPGSVLTT